MTQILTAANVAAKTPAEWASLIIGIIGAICIGIYVLPQCVKTIKTKDTSGVSLGMFVLSFCGGFLFFLSALINACIGKGIETWLPMLLGNFCSSVASIIVIALKIRNLKWANKFDLPESKIPENYSKIKDVLEKQKAAKVARKQAEKAARETTKADIENGKTDTPVINN